MLKKEARKLYRARRDGLSDTGRSILGDLLLIQFQTADLPMPKNVLSYWPIEENKEPDTHLFTGYLQFKFPQLQVLYPQANFEKQEMSAMAVYDDTRFIKNEFNIYEPEEGLVIPADEIDMVIVPLLAFDTKGYRVGYGKGFYDRFLATCRVDCTKLGFSYFDPVDRLDDCAGFDVPLDLCITPHNIYVF